MNIKKIVYIRCAPLSKHIFDSAMFKELIEQGIQVDYIDTTGLHAKNFKTAEYKGFKNIYKVQSSRDFRRYLKNQDRAGTLFINLVQFNYRDIGILYYLKKYDFRLGFFGRYAAKSTTVKTTLKQKLRGLWPKLIKRIGLRVAFVLKKKGYLKIYDYIFIGGNKALDYFFSGYFYKDDREKAKIILVNATDYDKYLAMRKDIKKVKKPHIVFIDQYLPYHPDFIIKNRRTIDPANYYTSLNNWFTNVEKFHNSKVVIAAHPKANHYTKNNPFDGREVIFNKTIELVAHCDRVLMHYSTSINFAILYSKPILFILNEDLERVLPIPAQMIKDLSKTLNCPVYYLEHDYVPESHVVNVQSYECYKYEYMTSLESENRNTFDIFTSFLYKL